MEASTLSTNHMLGYGSTGSDVLNLQKALGNLGYDITMYDGIYGPETKSQVRKFQQEHGLRVDGIAGIETLSHLNTHLCDSDYSSLRDNNIQQSVKNDVGMLGTEVEPFVRPTLNHKESKSDSILGNRLKDMGIGAFLDHVHTVTESYSSVLVDYIQKSAKSVSDSFLLLPMNSKFVILPDRVINRMNGWVNATSFCDNLVNSRSILNLIDNLEDTNRVFSEGNLFSKMLFASDRLGHNIGLYYGTGRFDFHWLESVIRQGKKLIREFCAVITKLLRINNNLLDKETILRIKELFNKILDFASGHMKRVAHIVDKSRCVTGIIKRIKKFAKFFPPLRLIASGLTIIELLNAILSGSKADILECLLTIVKDFLIGAVSTAIFTALMAVGVGEVAIALVILIAVLDYFFFNPDPENALIHGTRNIINDGVNVVCSV